MRAHCVFTFVRVGDDFGACDFYQMLHAVAVVGCVLMLKIA